MFYQRIRCNVTALAVSRFLLSLDSIHDPMATLLIMDYYALATQQNEHDQFIVDLVESKTVCILTYRFLMHPIFLFRITAHGYLFRLLVFHCFHVD
jgi:hypothetical protein